MKKQSLYFAYKRAKASDIRIPSKARNKPVRGDVFTFRPMIDRVNVRRNSNNAVISLLRKRSRRKLDTKQPKAK